METVSHSIFPLILDVFIVQSFDKHVLCVVANSYYGAIFHVEEVTQNAYNWIDALGGNCIHASYLPKRKFYSNYDPNLFNLRRNCSH